jgi:triacylglycerol lipase
MRTRSSAPQVRYYSFGGAKDPSEMFWALRFSAGIVAAAEGPNDGLVSVNSAQWGKYIGTLRADHVEQVNWRDWSLRSLLSDASEGPSDAVWASTASERAEAAEGLLRSQPADSGSESPTQGSFDALRFYSDLANVLSEL